MTNIRRLISWALIAYMLLAFGWWAYHLWEQNDQLFRVHKSLLELNFTKKNQGLNETQFLQTEEYRKIETYRDNQRNMVIGEGLFFTVCLFIGIYFVLHSANKEALLGKQRRNFMLSITHELKSPVAAMRLILETVGKRDLTREQREKICGDGLRESGRLQNLVESLLLAARLDGNWRPLPEPVDLAALVREITESLQLRFPQNHFRILIPEGLPPVSVDKTGLTSVIYNLFENAAKYSPPDTMITFEAGKTTAGKLHFSVSDAGVGIPDSEKKAVFEKFYRLGNEDTRNTQGTGLGLFIVNQVVKAHGGNIQISDNKPAGTIFSIEI